MHVHSNGPRNESFADLLYNLGTVNGDQASNSDALSLQSFLCLINLKSKMAPSLVSLMLTQKYAALQTVPTPTAKLQIITLDFFNRQATASYKLTRIFRALIVVYNATDLDLDTCRRP